MIPFDTSLLLLCLQFLIFAHSAEDTILNEKLSDAERDDRCCREHLSCCPDSKSSEPTNFEVRALLVKCPKPDICSEDNSRPRRTVPRPKKSSKECGEEKTCRTPNEVTSCNKKLKLTIKIRNTGITNCKNQYIIIDHVFDPLSDKKQKLANPYVLKIKQQPILQTYGLIAEGLVNYEAKEKVVNKNDEGYTGCNTNPDSNPTCGSVKYDESSPEVLPFSTGFCCSCEEGQNPSNFTATSDESGPEDQSLVDQEPPGGEASDALAESETLRQDRDLMPGFQKYNEKHYEFNYPAGRVKGGEAVNQRNRMGGNARLYSRPFRSANDRRLIPFGAKYDHKQKRGGQDCSDLYTPPNADPDSYHESTHCLEFSDLWYTVYQMTEPRIYHILQIEIYEKVQEQDGNFKWRDLTKNNPVVVGTARAHACNDLGSITVNYISKGVSPHMFSINYKVKKLLVPDISKNIDTSQFPAVQGGPPEYLVVDEHKVAPNGKLCNVAGVGYEAFAKQPQRCDVPKGTCLKNQPKDIWEQDQEAESSGKKGVSFLKYFGTIPENPIVINETTKNKTLVMYYIECHTSELDLEVKADSNQVMSSNSLAVLTDVYIDGTSPRKTALTVKVFNSGYVASIFHVKLAGCPMNLPATFNNIVSKPALIPPQHQHVYTLEIRCTLPKSSFFCTMQVLNPKQELIAVRKIRFQKEDRCICMWHCLCACLVADGGLKCSPLSLEHYHAAGFQGGLPIPLHVVHYTFLDDMISLMLFILLFLCLTLLAMGLVKAILGIFVVSIGLWGLDMILGLPKDINHYYESSIQYRVVIYDKHGWPVHPDTKQRVRNISLPAEFCINVVFFFIYPFAIFWYIIKRLCFSSYQDSKGGSGSDICVCLHDSKSKNKPSSSHTANKPKSSPTKSTVKGGTPVKTVNYQINPYLMKDTPTKSTVNGGPSPNSSNYNQKGFHDDDSPPPPQKNLKVNSDSKQELYRDDSEPPPRKNLQKYFDDDDDY